MLCNAYMLFSCLLPLPFPKYILGGWVWTAWPSDWPQWHWQRQVCRPQVRIRCCTCTCSLAQDDIIPVNRSQQSFKYDHLRKEASDYKPWTADSEVLQCAYLTQNWAHTWCCCVQVEGLRAAIEAEVTAYALNHYRHGVSATFSKPTEVKCPFALS